ncbi:DUF4367 domain-containing protein [Neobacillus notoginsengisoli]|uniref:DUF4367 domain-containing protein n=1 Tax=Neobacillus notoginsengisoli TaxID=1578198 RepID=A0A417YQ15_9BACI|nr:DUF4367 domain-containing protein [Neobacillus notoginsengisoli]RHW36085.1 DUF4367 domain-containing protein [Neobacillus notoginsengisoli]
MKKFKKLFFSSFWVLVCSLLISSSVSAGGQNNVYIFPLGSSGSTGGSWSTVQTINSGPYFSACGKVTYNLAHVVSFGAWTSTNWKWNNSTFRITNLSGKVTGGVGFTGNYESTASNSYDYKYSGVQLYSNTTYTYSWNRNMPLGPKNKNAHYDISTISGFPNPAIICENTAKVVFDVGGKTSSTMFTNLATPLEFSNNKENLATNLGEEYNEQSKMFGQSAIVTHFENGEHNFILLTQQKDSPININNINDNVFLSINDNGFEYEIGSFQNEANSTLNVVKFQKKGTYMALVANLSKEEILKIAEDL